MDECVFCVFFTHLMEVSTTAVQQSSNCNVHDAQHLFGTVETGVVEVERAEGGRHLQYLLRGGRRAALTHVVLGFVVALAQRAHELVVVVELVGGRQRSRLVPGQD